MYLELLSLIKSPLVTYPSAMPGTGLDFNGNGAYGREPYSIYSVSLSERHDFHELMVVQI